MSILFFKRPNQSSNGEGPLTLPHEVEGAAQAACTNAAIPPELSFENILCNKCAPPCALQDFLDYMVYIERRAENLQFYLWMVDYHGRYRSAPKSLTALSPLWNDDTLQDDLSSGVIQNRPAEDLGHSHLDKHSVDISSVSTWDCEQSEFSDHFTQTTNTLKFSVSPVKQKSSQKKYPSPVSFGKVQPFRAEVNKILNHYLVAGSPRQLNLSRHDRVAVIRALTYTTDPSALSRVKKMLDTSLRRESYPNFVRWSICNGNKQWNYASRILGTTNFILGFIIAVILTLSSCSRYWRIFAALEWWIGLTNIIAATQGLCIILHRMHCRQHHAWETQNPGFDDDEAMLQGADGDLVDYEETKPKWPVKMEVFGPSNNYSTEPWVEAYHQKPWHRKLFERRLPVGEPGLRHLQNRMVRQAEAWALIITVPLTIIFVALPKGNFF